MQGDRLLSFSILFHFHNVPEERRRPSRDATKEKELSETEQEPTPEACVTLSFPSNVDAHRTLKL